MRTEATLSALVAALTANCGDIYEACREVGLSPLFLSRWRKDDAKVNGDIEEACRVGTMRIESIAIQRVAHGTAEDVYYKGEVVGERRDYHDGLMQTILKGRIAHVYGSDAAQSNIFNGPVQINNMPRATNYDEWLGMKDAQEAREQRKRLPAPDNDALLEKIVDAGTDFTVVHSPQFAGLGL